MGRLAVGCPAGSCIVVATTTAHTALLPLLTQQFSNLVASTVFTLQLPLVLMGSSAWPGTAMGANRS